MSLCILLTYPITCSPSRPATAGSWLPPDHAFTAIAVSESAGRASLIASPSGVKSYGPDYVGRWSAGPSPSQVHRRAELSRAKPCTSTALSPLERREVPTHDSFCCQVLLPADSVALVCLDEIE